MQGSENHLRSFMLAVFAFQFEILILLEREFLKIWLRFRFKSYRSGLTRKEPLGFKRENPNSDYQAEDRGTELTLQTT